MWGTPKGWMKGLPTNLTSFPVVHIIQIGKPHISCCLGNLFSSSDYWFPKTPTHKRVLIVDYVSRFSSSLSLLEMFLSLLHHPSKGLLHPSQFGLLSFCRRLCFIASASPRKTHSPPITPPAFFSISGYPIYNWLFLACSSRRAGYQNVHFNPLCLLEGIRMPFPDELRLGWCVFRTHFSPYDIPRCFWVTTVEG